MIWKSKKCLQLKFVFNKILANSGTKMSFFYVAKSFQILQIFGFLDSQSHWLCFRLKKFIFLGKGWKPISQVKVSELPVWLLRRDWSPNGVMKGFSRGWWRWNFAYSFRPGKGSYAALIQFALSYSFVMAVIEFGRKSKFYYLFSNLFSCGSMELVFQKIQ